ncbi:LLM class flavin-dependent oxidoreductase, partial [Staphylococcus gallinarum]
MKIELGLTSFADNMDLHTEVGTHPDISNAQTIRNII